MSDQNRFVFSPFHENSSEGISCSMQQYGQMDGQTDIHNNANIWSLQLCNSFNRNMSYKNNRQISTVLASSFSSTGLNKSGALILSGTLRTIELEFGW